MSGKELIDIINRKIIILWFYWWLFGYRWNIWHWRWLRRQEAREQQQKTKAGNCQTGKQLLIFHDGILLKVVFCRTYFIVYQKKGAV